VSELHLGRLPEAEAALQQAVQLDAQNADTLANLIVLNTLLGKKEEVTQLKDQLAGVDSKHQVLTDWAEKKQAFDQARLKYTPKFEAAA
jgi:coatomer protein complex subunit epsilon